MKFEIDPAQNSPPIIIIIIVNIFSVSVSGETFPKPTEVMQVMVK